MNQWADFVSSMRRLFKLYDHSLESICEEYRLSQVEITIISFLHNNPSKDMASHISELRGLPKGNVSQGVESLIKKGLLTRTPDRQDRRKIHLALQPPSLPIVEKIEVTKKEFLRQMFAGFTEEEIACWHSLNRRLAENITKALAEENIHGR